MTPTVGNIVRLATSAALFLALLAGTSVVPASAQVSSSLSKKELKALATTQGGHQRLASYYRDKAQQLRDKAEKFSAQADYLATQPALIESKQGISCNCTSHYRYFSKQYTQEAIDTDALAAHEEQLARTTNPNR